METARGTDGDPEPITGFDQTNGLVEGLEGDADGFASSDEDGRAAEVSEAPMTMNRIGAYTDFGITGDAVDADGRPLGMHRRGFPVRE